MRKTLRISLAISALGLAASAASWSSVPVSMPVHWNAAGQPNGFAPRALGLLLMPVFAAGVSGLLHLGHAKLPKKVSGALAGTAVLTTCFFVGLHGSMIRAALTPGHVLSMGAVTGLLGLLFAGLGYLMRDIDPNGLIGIRLPWTLGDEVVWKLTHRFAARTFLIGGVASFVAALTLPGRLAFGIGMLNLIVGTVAPMIYSYAVSRMRR